MKFEEYRELSARTMPKGLENKDTLTNMCMGLAGESGELIDHIKKVCFHGHELDKAYISKELGDILWYVAGLATALKIDLDDVAQANVDKLKARYPEGFSQEASLNRTV